MQPRDRLSTKEIQVATLVWQGLTNKDIGQVLGTSEQVVKNYLRTTFDKLGVWTRLELALYVASHGGSSWHVQLGLDPHLRMNCGTWKQPQGFASHCRVKPCSASHVLGRKSAPFVEIEMHWRITRVVWGATELRLGSCGRILSGLPIVKRLRIAEVGLQKGQNLGSRPAQELARAFTSAI
jgi:DNA-binding CsgD family transcriptional regulator